MGGSGRECAVDGGRVRATEGGALRVLVVLGHPRRASLCGAIAESYREGAGASGAEVRYLALAQLAFHPHVEAVPSASQSVEPELAEACAALAWAQHLVFVYPLWWGMMPALLKGFIDRAFAPGFAFRERPGHQGYEGLLRGRTAELLVTMDTPTWVYRWLLGAPGVRAMRRDVLGFCGIAPVDVQLFGPVATSDRPRRERWLDQARWTGARLATRRRRWLGDQRRHAWMRALRLQFYPLTWLAYGLGAVAAGSGRPGALAVAPLLAGFAWLTALEAATVFANELWDVEGDRGNANHGPFTGGSRVLVEGVLARRDLGRGMAVALAGSALAFAALLAAVPGPIHLGLLALGVLGTLLCLGYTVPPLRLAYRGLGELDVALTHALMAVLAGWMAQGAAPAERLPWLLSLPLACAILPSIILAGIPDREADLQVGKGTLAVRLGARGAARAALGAAGAAALLALAAPMVVPAFGGLAWFALPHALLLAWLVRRRGALHGRIDALLVASLTFMVWFVLVPLVNLW